MTGGRDNTEEALSSCTIKVHHLMCKELKKYVDRTTQLLPALESAQPGCTSGIDALCHLNLALEKAKLLVQHCSESSKLYLVITGNAIKLRCERVQRSLGQSLSQLQSMVPLLLAAQVDLMELSCYPLLLLQYLLPNLKLLWINNANITTAARWGIWLLIAQKRPKRTNAY